MSNLEQEIATYYRHLPELLGQYGRFVLIKGTDVAGTFDSYRDALTAGYQRFQLDSFLVKQINLVECLAIDGLGRRHQSITRTSTSGPSSARARPAGRSSSRSFR